MGKHTLTARQYGILALVALSAPLGDTFLSRGMTQMPTVTLDHPLSLISAVFTPWIALGIALLIGFFIFVGLGVPIGFTLGILSLSAVWGFW